MKDELIADFGIASARVSVIPFGINNTSPVTTLARQGARERIGLSPSEKVLLFFGRIAPYKGVEVFDRCHGGIGKTRRRAIVSSSPGGQAGMLEAIGTRFSVKIARQRNYRRQIVARIVRFIPEIEVEIFFKAADVVVIPYVQIFQSGVPFLSYSFGLPVIATDVGSLTKRHRRGKDGVSLPPEGSC